MRECFVVMPIKRADSDEYIEYRALYDTVIRPPLKEAGFNVTRADDVTKGGAINADVIRRLASADLVIADLSDLNANVFYEVGIRHALRRTGTLMIIDNTKTAIPFDLQGYRVIEFSPNLLGYEKLRESLKTFTESLHFTDDDIRDSPVHDTLPSLPANVFANSDGSAEGRLREEVANLRKQLNRYSEKYGVDSTHEQATETVARMLEQAKRGELPIDLYYQARKLGKDQDTVGFLSIVHQLISAHDAVLSAEQWVGLSADARALNLTEVAQVIHWRAIEQRPSDDRLKELYYGSMAHSEDPRQRELARRELANLSGVVLEPGSVAVADNLQPSKLGTVALMLDACARDGLTDLALQVTQLLIERFPTNTLVLRNHARSLADQGRMEEAFECYELAMQAPDADDTTATWYGNDLSSLGREKEAYRIFLQACELDPDDPKLFIRSARECVDAFTTNASLDSLPFSSAVRTLIVCAFSCKTVTNEHLEGIESCIEDADLGVAFLKNLVDLRNGEIEPTNELHLLSKKDRVVAAAELLQELKPYVDGNA